MSAATEASTADREIRVVRTFDAPRELVFDAMTKPEHVRRWYGPRRFTLTVCEIDLRPGGRFRYVMRGADGVEHAFGGEYLEVARPSRLVNTWVYEPVPEAVSIETATLEERDGRTVVELHSLFPSVEAFRGWSEAGGRAGMEETLERLTALVGELAASDPEREVVLDRFFAAPRERVFDAWTDAGALGRWFGPHGFRLTTHEADIREGGVWRYTMHGPDGTDYPNRMRYLEVVRPERIVYLHSDDVDDDPHAFHTTVTFREEPGGTRLVSRMRFPTAEAREGALRFGALELGYQTMERLEGWLRDG